MQPALKPNAPMFLSARETSYRSQGPVDVRPMIAEAAHVERHARVPDPAASPTRSASYERLKSKPCA